MANYPAKVLETLQETPRVRIFRLEREKSFDFSPGQFAMLSIEGLKGKEGALVKRSYSIASSPLQKELEFCITKAENGVFSGAMHSLRPGATVNVQGPYGAFRLKRPVRENTTFVAGGSGIAPLMSMLRTLILEGNTPRGMRLFYGFRAPEDYTYKKEIESMAKSGKLSVTLTVDQPTPSWKGEKGFVSEAVKRHSDYQKTDAYVCGPPIMVPATIKALVEAGFRPEGIYKEQW
ncbi:FAD-dependent oxidoreductase [Candidatus Woesearchaeota archaeon]|nr:FAD-dependent oxidoreductase [Candidatus Woesearchaeota archaeon]